MAKKEKDTNEESKDVTLSILDKLIEETEKKYGKGAIMNLEEGVKGIEFISSGSLGLDYALGGGYPKGRIVEILGEPSTAKTTLAIHAMVEAQKQGGIVGFIDIEHAFSLEYSKNLGLDISKRKFQISQPSNAEESLDICESMVKTGIFSLVILDSVAAMSPKSEIDGDFGDSKMGLHARLMSQAMRKLTAIISKTNTVVIFINQTRTALNVMWGDNTTTPGGNALKFYSSQRIQTYKSGQTKDGEEIVANGCKCKVIKNKVSPPFRQTTFNVIFGKGIDKFGETIDLAVENGIIKKAGSWFSFEETKLGQGIESVKSILEDNPELFEIIQSKVKEVLNQPKN